MKTSRLIKFAWVFFALLISNYTLSAQSRRMDQNDPATNSNRSVIGKLSGLTTTQQEQIGQIENGYQLVMGELRTQMQNAVDVNEKNALRSEMQQLSQNHQTNIKRLLTKEQKKEYNKLLAENRPAQTPQGRGKGNGQGQGRGGMRGGGQGKRY